MEKITSEDIAALKARTQSRPLTPEEIEQAKKRAGRSKTKTFELCGKKVTFTEADFEAARVSFLERIEKEKQLKAEGKLSENGTWNIDKLSPEEKAGKCYCNPGQSHCGVCIVCGKPGHIRPMMFVTLEWCDECFSKEYESTIKEMYDGDA
jgi:hypothetical protein